MNVTSPTWPYSAVANSEVTLTCEICSVEGNISGVGPLRRGEVTEKPSTVNSFCPGWLPAMETPFDPVGPVESVVIPGKVTMAFRGVVLFRGSSWEALLSPGPVAHHVQLRSRW